jgi:hypothetical protein
MLFLKGHIKIFQKRNIFLLKSLFTVMLLLIFNIINNFPHKPRCVSHAPELRRLYYSLCASVTAFLNRFVLPCRLNTSEKITYTPMGNLAFFSSSPSQRK